LLILPTPSASLALLLAVQRVFTIRGSVLLPIPCAKNAILAFR
jgi:hypothetical protein